MAWLETTLRVLGFVVAVFGSGAAVPAATWRLINGAGKRVEGVVRRLLRRPRAVQVTATAGAIRGRSARATATATGEITGGTLEERLNRLEERVKRVDENQQKTAAALAQESATRAQEHADLRGHVDQEVAQLHSRFEDEQRATEEVDAEALPVVLVGAAISAFPDLWGHSLVVGLVTVVFGLLAGRRAVVLLVRARPKSE